MFPTQVRGQAVQMISIFGLLAIISQPMIQTLFEGHGISMIFSFCIACMVILVVNTQNYETLNIPPPEIIEELQYEEKVHIDESLKRS